ncbi:MAG TPA: hypothetical protein VN723_13670 [Rhizomicrobium sp.]|nr:hypothetical protein [Rhizomicrobium sp.]
MRRFFVDQSGVAAAEYALILAIIGAALGTAVAALGGYIAKASEGGFLHPVDWLALIPAFLVALIATFIGKKGTIGTRSLEAFLGTVTVVYLFLMAFGVLFDRALLETILSSNSLLIVAAFLYTGLMSIIAVLRIFGVPFALDIETMKAEHRLRRRIS